MCGTSVSGVEESDDDRQHLMSELRALIDHGLSGRVCFPESRSLPAEPYASTGSPRVIIAIDGTMLLRSNCEGADAVRDYYRGDCVYIAPHAWTVPVWEVRHAFFGIVFRPNHVRYLHGICDGTGAAPAPRCWHTRLAFAPSAHHVLNALNGLPRFPRFDGDASLLIEALLRFSLVHLVRDGGEPLTACKSRRTYQLVCDYVDRNAHVPISRLDAAAAVGITPSHLSRLFSEYAQSSFSSHLLKVRMDRAAAILADESLTVKEVAYHCGYRDLSYFIRSFRAYHGTSPGHWRLRCPVP